jgi:hypothetical protein
VGTPYEAASRVGFRVWGDAQASGEDNEFYEEGGARMAEGTIAQYCDA